MPTHPQHRPLRVLVVDDHHLFRTGVRELLEGEGFEVVDVESGEAALRRVPSFGPDVVLMDLGMPGMSGIEATSRLRDAAPGSRVLVFTMSDDDRQVLHAVRAGASGYLLKDAELRDVTAAIRAVAAGHSPLAPRVARVLVDEIRRGGDEQPVTTEPALKGLSEREREVLALIAEGCDNGQIARLLYVSPSTVKNHVSRLLEKLQLDNRVQAATYAIRHGISPGEPLST
jgi:DNA-binding NarL/FixJ family response regulator